MESINTSQLNDLANLSLELVNFGLIIDTLHTQPTSQCCCYLQVLCLLNVEEYKWTKK